MTVYKRKNHEQKQRAEAQQAFAESIAKALDLSVPYEELTSAEQNVRKYKRQQDSHGNLFGEDLKGWERPPMNEAAEKAVTELFDPLGGVAKRLQSSRGRLKEESLNFQKRLVALHAGIPVCVPMDGGEELYLHFAPNPRGEWSLLVADRPQGEFADLFDLPETVLLEAARKFPQLVEQLRVSTFQVLEDTENAVKELQRILDETEK